MDKKAELERILENLRKLIPLAETQEQLVSLIERMTDTQITLKLIKFGLVR